MTTCISLNTIFLLESGVKLKDIQERFMTYQTFNEANADIYTHVTSKMNRETAERLIHLTRINLVLLNSSPKLGFEKHIQRDKIKKALIYKAFDK
ncbi:hypothetical protein AYJ08_10950 [Brevibacillus sp. SKDU10]|nr:hypothetical protein AYJ08_10950 [Brevibacillus sp. SKDU10]